jgi:hypothetical protein
MYNFSHSNETLKAMPFINKVRKQCVLHVPEKRI